MKLKKRIKRLRVRLSDAVDLRDSRNLDISDIKSVCLALGPYRNLTTLTASILFLHPNCQVLNHAGRRVYGNREIDFLWDYNKEKLDRFVQFAIKISGKGQRGPLGGSITYSHAFDSIHNVKGIYEKSGSGMIKKQIKCLFWKESLRTSNAIRERNVDLAGIFKSDERLRFLLPIRHPLDCAVSNLKTGHVRIFRGLTKDSSIFEVAKAILDEIFWFADLKKEFPGRFFYYLEREISRDMLVHLAKFLLLDPDETWVSNALSAMKIKPGYDHDSKLIDFYRDYVVDKGSRFPELSKSLLAFLNSRDGNER